MVDSVEIDLPVNKFAFYGVKHQCTMVLMKAVGTISYANAYASCPLRKVILTYKVYNTYRASYGRVQVYFDRHS